MMLLQKPQQSKKALSKDRRQAIRGRIIAMMRDAEPTPFSFEGPCRAGIRSSLCLQGWAWMSADLVAAEIVEMSLKICGAKRPTWNEGQPEWTQAGVVPTQRERCIRCFRPVPEGRFKYCGPVCKGAHNAWMRYQRMSEEINAMARAREAARKNNH